MKAVDHPAVNAGGNSTMKPETNSGANSAMGSVLDPDPSSIQLELEPSSQAPLQPVMECKGIRPTSDFPRDLHHLSAEQIEHHYQAMRNSHASLSRSRGQLLRRSRELSQAREHFLASLRSYEDRLLQIGEQKAEAMHLAQDLHRELQAFETRQQAMDQLLHEFDAAKQEAGFWAVFQINQLLERLRALLRGGGERSDG
jgi:hypothetical protein